jgi:hypothetical protein
VAFASACTTSEREIAMDKFWEKLGEAAGGLLAKLGFLKSLF